MIERSELPNIPASWSWTKIGNITEVVRGGSPRPKGDPRYFGGSIPWIMIADVSKERGKYLTKTRESVTELGSTKSRFLKAGSLILSNSGTVCVPKILRIDGCIHDGFVSFTTLPNSISKDFLYYWFEFIRPRIIRENKQGITQVNLNTTIVRNIDVPIPPTSEQYRIVEKIEEVLTDLDAGVAALERVEKALERYRASVLKAAVEGKLTVQWRAEHPDVEPASELLERTLKERRANWEKEQLAKYEASGKKPPKNWQAKYKEPAIPDTSELPELPKGWCWASLDSMADIKGGITKGQRRKVEVGKRSVPYLRVANVQRGYLDLNVVKTIEATENEIKLLRLQPGDVLFNEGGDRDKLGRGWIWKGELAECIHQNHVFRARPLVNDFASELISHWGNSFGKVWFMMHGKQTVNLASINLNVLRRFPIPVPPVAEQPEIVQQIDSRLSIVKEIESQVVRALKRASRLRQSILKRAFEGKLVPQDTNDEPADVLLERIQSQRESAEQHAKRNGQSKRKARKRSRSNE